MLDFITAIDFYKTGHVHQLEPGTEYIYENFTARAPRTAGWDSVVFFWLQACLKYDMTDLANQTFFSRSKSDVLYDYQKMLDNCLPPQKGLTLEHIAALWDYQCIPVEFCALPEGLSVPYKIPMFTMENTHPDFAWVPGYLEDLLSSRLWLPMTSATTAKRYRQILDQYNKLTGGDTDFIQWQGHDFSFRGMGSPEAAVASGAGHLLSFTGTDVIPAIKALKDCYQGEGLIGGSIPATEHMVMCLSGEDNELKTYERILNVHKTGPVSIVADTWNLWDGITVILRKLHNKIMERDGKVVVRPDSGDPVLILTGDASAPVGSPAHKGVVQLLWDEFGGTNTYKGFKLLDSHIGVIYGDSITEERAHQISTRLLQKGFASTNVVYGIGSYTYQYATRDTHGFAIKATWAQVKGQERMLFKDPVTDSGLKKSARGRLSVYWEGKYLALKDGMTKGEQRRHGAYNLLQPVWRDGKFLVRHRLSDIRKRVNS